MHACDQALLLQEEMTLTMPLWIGSSLTTSSLRYVLAFSDSFTNRQQAHCVICNLVVRSVVTATALNVTGPYASAKEHAGQSDVTL